MTDGGSTELGTDDEVMVALATASRAVGGPPPDVVAAAKATFTWRTIDAELAELTFDSGADSDALAGVRSGGGARALTFEHDDVVVEVEVNEDAGGRTLVGQVGPAAPEWVELQQASGAAAVRFETDDMGRFRVPGVASGPVRLLCRFPAGGRPELLTAWVTI